MNSFTEWMSGNGQEVVNAAIGSAFTGLLAFCLWYFRYWSSGRRLRQGDASNHVVIQLNLLVDGALLLRNLSGSTTIRRLFEEDPAAQSLIGKAASSTTVQDPLLRFQGAEGEQLLHGIVNHVVDRNAQSPYSRNNLLLAVTCEDRSLVRRLQVRVLLIKQEDLLKFADPAFCESVKVEKPWQGVRIVALHQWALDYKNQCERRSGEQLPLTRLVQLGHPDDYTPLHPVRVDWSKGYPASALKLSGIGAWAQPEVQPA